jgi:hypothetical protein
MRVIDWVRVSLLLRKLDAQKSYSTPAQWRKGEHRGIA